MHPVSNPMGDGIPCHTVDRSEKVPHDYHAIFYEFRFIDGYSPESCRSIMRAHG